MIIKHTKNNLILLFAFFNFFLTINAQTVIDFDTSRDPNKTLQSELARLVNQNPGAIIEFSSSEYNFNGANINIPKSITFRGTTNSNTINLTNNGADNTNIGTKFIDCGTINFRANNINIENLSLQKTRGGKFNVFINMVHPTYNDKDLDTNQFYTGISFNNVEISGGGYQVRVGNGIGGSFTNVSFLDFNVIGFWFNRRGNIDTHPKVDWTNCTFRVKNTPGATPQSGQNIEFNDRAISLDGGNTSYPIVWGHNGSKIEKCRFIDTGIGASSRGTNVVINDNTFDDSAGIVDLIRIEEFSSDFEITNNTFNCIGDAFSRVLVFDRELQSVSDINIDNNIITGEIQVFLSAYAPDNLTITNNDFTNASTQLSTPIINLTYYENEIDEPITPRSSSDRSGDFVSENIIFTNNTGLDRNEAGEFIVNLANGDITSTIDFPSARKKVSFIDPPKQLLPNGTYEIVNIETGLNLVPSGMDGGLVTSNTFDSSASWNINFVPPFSYNIQNVSTNNYLELSIPFVESDIFGNPNNLPTISPFEKNNWNSITPSKVNRLPFWSFRKEEDTYVIFPGGNEKQSALADNIQNVNMVLARKADGGRRVPVELGNNAKWRFRSTNENYVTWNSNANRSFETGETTSQNVSYGVRATDETIKSLEFSLAILDKETDNITSIVSTQEIANNSASSSDNISFNYIIPNNITPSNQLSANETYSVQVKLITNVSGDPNEKVTSIETPIEIFKAITETEISWDSKINTSFTIGSTTEQIITYNVLPTEIPQYTQFGLVILDTNNNIVEIVKPQEFPTNPNTTLLRETRSINFTVPNGILASDELPTGQEYAIRALIASTVNDRDQFKTETTPVQVNKPNGITWDTNDDTEFEVGETTSQSISYKVDPTVTIKFIQFGLIIVNATNNSFISGVAPQVAVPGNNTISEGSRTFNFKVPDGIVPSSNLPDNQKYRIRARVVFNTQATPTVDSTLLEFTDVTIREAGFSFVSWESSANKELEIGTTTSQSIAYRVQPTDNISFITYSLIIRTENNNAFVSVVGTPTNVIGNNTLSEGNRTFDFSLPNTTTTSENLPNNQKYSIRVRIDGTDESGIQLPPILEFTDVNIGEENTLSISKIESSSTTNIDLTLYPNPILQGQEIVNVKSDGNSHIYSFYDISGKLIQKVIGINTIEISGLPSGIYFVKNEIGKSSILIIK